MGKVSRIEPNDYILVDASDSLRLKLQQIGWLEFIRKFHGHNLEATKQFAATFDGKRVVIENLELPVTQETIVEATSLPNIGEEWFKGKFDKNIFHWNQFFKPNTPQEFGKGLWGIWFK